MGYTGVGRKERGERKACVAFILTGQHVRKLSSRVERKNRYVKKRKKSMSQDE